MCELTERIRQPSVLIDVIKVAGLRESVGEKLKEIERVRENERDRERERERERGGESERERERER